MIGVEREVNVSVDRARDWFLSLEEHPERYRFATHEGIEFAGGNFGDVGARFRTREKFYFLKLELTETECARPCRDVIDNLG